jgi:hypothetical protein
MYEINIGKHFLTVISSNFVRKKQFWFVTVSPKYINIAIFPKDVLHNFIKLFFHSFLCMCKPVKNACNKQELT